MAQRHNSAVAQPISDRQRLYAAAFLRAALTGLMGVLLGLYLARRGFDAAAIGFVIGSGLAGAATATTIVTFFGDRLGRKPTLVVLALLTVAGGVMLLLVQNVATACAIAFLGMVNGAGRDRAAALALEHAMLPQTTDDAGRTRAFAWYNVLQDVGHALGALGAPCRRRWSGTVAWASSPVMTRLSCCMPCSG